MRTFSHAVHNAAPPRTTATRPELDPPRSLLSHEALALGTVRIVVATCSVDYAGRLTAHLAKAKRLLLLKADGSVLVHSDGGSYKPLNWMSPPATVKFEQIEGAEDAGIEATSNQDEGHLAPSQRWTVQNLKSDDQLVITIYQIHHDSEHDLGVDPGLVKDGVEAHLQKLLAEQIETLGSGWKLVRREFPTAIGPVDILARNDEGGAVAVEIKRRGEIDGVEQLTRYLELLNRDPLLTPVTGIFAAQEIRPQARVLAEDRGIRCVVLDYDAMRGIDDPDSRLF